ncbi:MAG: hypothetical protein AB7Q42_17015 [Acidimicrobiia bacterium]
MTSDASTANTPSAPSAPSASGTASASSSSGLEHDEHLLLDRIDALRVLRADTVEEKSRLLEELGGHGKPEQDLVNELSKPRPLWRPDRFEEAHRLAMRGIEVLDRNGARPAKMPKGLGPIAPLAQWPVQQVNRWIVKSHQNTIIERIRKLYERREANSVWGTPEHRMLRRARINAVQVEQGFKGNALGLPTFLLGGAFISAIFGALQSAVRSALDSRLGVAIFAAVLFVVLAALAWVALYAAAVSRRRIRLAVDQPLKALYETIGACGDPPKDQSYNFAIYAIVLFSLAWIIVPLAIWLAIRG